MQTISRRATARDARAGHGEKPLGQVSHPGSAQDQRQIGRTGRSSRRSSRCASRRRRARASLRSASWRSAAGWAGFRSRYSCRAQRQEAVRAVAGVVCFAAELASSPQRDDDARHPAFARVQQAVTIRVQPHDAPDIAGRRGWRRRTASVWRSRRRGRWGSRSAVWRRRRGRRGCWRWGCAIAVGVAVGVAVAVCVDVAVAVGVGVDVPVCGKSYTVPLSFRCPSRAGRR